MPILFIYIFVNSSFIKLFIFRSKWSIDAETIQWLAEISDGDARIALNCLQMAIQSVIKCDSGTLIPQITLNDVKDSIKVNNYVLIYMSIFSAILEHNELNCFANIGSLEIPHTVRQERRRTLQSDFRFT